MSHADKTRPGARRLARILALTTLAALAALANGGCRSAPEPAPEPAPNAAPAPSLETAPAQEAVAPARPRWLAIGVSVDGRPIDAASFGDGPRTILALASIHGDEPAGTPLLHELARRLAEGPDWLADRRVVVVPVANPDGLEEDRRHNARGVDLNRNFPADNRRQRSTHGAQALSEPEAQALHELLLAEQPDVVVSIHQAANCIDYDGPAEELARRMAEASGLPVERLGARPGSLGSFAGVDLGIPTITVELPRSATGLAGPESWARYGAMMRAAIESP